MAALGLLQRFFNGGGWRVLLHETHIGCTLNINCNGIVFCILL